MTDEELMAAYQRGDGESFAQLVARHERPLWNFLCRFVRDSAAAEDLLQEVFLRVVRSRSDWQASAKFSTWLYTIARNLTIDHARRVATRPASSTPHREAPSTVDGFAGQDRGGEVAAQNREMASRIEAAVATLPEAQREVFLLREVMDMPFSEIAQAVGASMPTVKSRMRYALEALRKALEEFRDSGAFAAVVDHAEQSP